MSHDAAILILLLLLTGALLAPAAPRRPATRSRQPAALGPHIGPYERWEAERKGQALLRQLLSAEEHTHLQEHGYLDVPSRAVAGRVYRIPRRRGVVEGREADRPVGRFCVVPDRWLPDSDIVLLHKLMIEADEERYLRIANHLPVPASGDTHRASRAS